ncbi:MAG: hypothetical protein AB7I41_14615 [Candidatus Sericytochromatia bacterium]
MVQIVSCNGIHPDNPRQKSHQNNERLISPAMHMQLFQEITQANDQLSALSKKRQQEADRHYKMGFQILDTAYKQRFQNLALLEQACNEFIQAMRHNRSDVRPYLALSYLFSLVNNYPNAWKYAKAAKDLEPQNEVVLNWLKTLSEQENKFEIKKQRPPELGHSGEQGLDATPQNIQQMYAKLQTFLVAQVKHVMELKAPEPSLDNAALHEMNMALHIFQQNAEQIEKQFSWLEKHRNIDDLRKLYTPFEANLRRYREAIGVAMSLSELLERIQELSSEVERCHGQIERLQDPQEIPPVSETLEAILDQCDYLADNIDYLDTQGYDLSLLEKSYAALTQQVSGCQDLLDNTVERFNKMRRQRKAEMPPEPSTAGIKPLLQKLPDAHLAALAERLWFLMPINPVEKISLGLHTFCLNPDKQKMLSIVKELLNTLSVGASSKEEASIYGLLAIIFYSYRKPLLAVEYMDFADTLAKDLPHTARLKDLLVTFSRQRLSLKTTAKKPVLQGVSRLLATTTLPIDQVAESLRLLLPSQMHQKAPSLYLEARELLCDYCMNPTRNTLLAAADRLLMGLTGQDQAAEVYALLGAIFFAMGKPLLAQEYIGFAQALMSDLEEASYVLQRVGFLKMPDPAKTPLVAAPTAGNTAPAQAAAPPKVVRKPAPAIAMSTLQNAQLNLAEVAKKLSPLLKHPGDFATDYAPIQLLENFSFSPSPSGWGEAIHSLNQVLESNEVRAEDFALMGLLLFACGKPLLLLEYLDYARSQDPNSALVQRLQDRFRKR